MDVRITDDSRGEDLIEIEAFDVYDHSVSLGPVVLAWLRKYRELHKGYPAAMTEDEWDGILGRMIWSFEQTLTASERPADKAQIREYDERVGEGLELFGKWYRDLWS